VTCHRSGSSWLHLAYNEPVKLPNVEDSVVRPEKISGYLLSESHPVGRHKAKFFTGFGFSGSSWRQLEEALRQHAVENEVMRVDATPFGSAYVIDGPLHTPAGDRPRVRAVWFVESGAVTPYFVTAHPLEKPR
jgi:hypothetical protein